MSQPGGLRQGLRYGIIVLLVAFAVESATRAGWLADVENLYYDLWHKLADKRFVPQHVALISVDDETLLDLREDPMAFWAPHFGQAMNTLSQAGVKAIGLDFRYAVSAETWLKKLKLPDSEISRNYDVPLRAQLAAGQVVLISHLVANQSGGAEILLPPEDHLLVLPGGLADTGLANLFADDDGVTRRFVPAMIADASLPGMTFATQLSLRAAGLDPGQTSWSLAGQAITRSPEPRTIGYSGPPNSVPQISMARLLKPDALQDPQVRALKGKVAIIAANDSGGQDRHLSPYSRWQGGMMVGGEIHANIVETLLTGRYPRTLPGWVQTLYLLGVTMVGVLFYIRLHPSWGLAAGCVVAVQCAILSYFFFVQNWILPVANTQLALVAGFLSVLGLRLTGEERQRAQLKQIFGRYVSDDVVTKILAAGQGPDLKGETLQVTVLFSDIRNFTTISEKLDAHEVVEMLNAYFSRVTEPILEQGGMVNKYIGDAVMAIFGSPVFYPDHARRGIIAALGMAREAASFKEWMRSRFPDRDLPEFGVGVGLHTGEAVIGDIGTIKRKEFTAIGDTVNAASRLEGVTKEMGCVIAASAVTVAAAGEGVVTGLRETITVKGRAEPIEVFEIKDLKARGVEAGQAPEVSPKAE